MKILSLYEKTQDMLVHIIEEMEPLDLENPDEEFVYNELNMAKDHINRADDILTNLKARHEPV